MSSPSIYILSGGAGSSGEHLVNTVLAQYPDSRVKVTIVGSLRHPEQLLAALAQAQAEGALVVHTLVEKHLRDLLLQQAPSLGLTAIDLAGPLIDWLTPALGEQPAGLPGLYRQLNRQYYERLAAIDFTLAHDDGKNPAGWEGADVMLVGVSRAGKTPLSLYLAVSGWKVANYPLVPQIPVPQALFDLDAGRVFGLNINTDQLLIHRMRRQAALGVSGTSDYVDPEAVADELRAARQLFRRGGFQVLEMTDKPIELAADEIIRRVAPRR